MISAIDASHRLFKDFKHHRLEVNNWLTFTPGMGGNFLLAAMGSNHTCLRSVNEYLVHDVLSWGWQNQPIDSTVSLDDIYQAVERWLHTVATDQAYQLGYSHMWPSLACAIFDMQMHAMSWISMDARDGWIIHALCRIKLLLNSNWETKPWMMESLLENQISTGSVHWYEFHAMCQRIEETFQTDLHRNSIMAWRWYLRCKADSMDIYNVDGFSAAVLGTVFGNLRETYQDEHSAHHTGDWPLAKTEFEAYHLLDTQDDLSFLQAHIPLVNRLDWRSFFFDLAIPRDGMLSQISKQRLARYSNENIRVLRRASAFLPVPYRQIAYRELDALQEMLSRAVRRRLT